MSEPKTSMVRKDGYFWIYFVGTRNGRWVQAETLKSAKKIFAISLSVPLSSYIVGRLRGPELSSV